MRILITNDDGARAPGLVALADVARKFGEVKIIAPDHERSGCGHSMTMLDPLRVRPIQWEATEAYEVNGLPVDCVNIGLSLAWPDGCDLILSGFNGGPNLGFDVTYSGTVGGAMEGAINGIRSISLSMASFVSGGPVHYGTGARWLEENLEKLLSLPAKPLSFLNINIPNLAYPEIQGEKVVAMGKRVYEERVELRYDPWNRPYYWQGGVVVMDPDQPGTDVEAVDKGYVAITPVSLDWTDYAYAEEMEKCLRRCPQSK